jgi:hypothetical protein
VPVAPQPMAAIDCGFTSNEKPSASPLETREICIRNPFVDAIAEAGKRNYPKEQLNATILPIAPTPLPFCRG